MKKTILMLSVALATMSVSAAQINWGATGQIKFDNNLVGNAGVTLQLVYLGDLTNVSDWPSYAKEVANGTTDNVVATKKTNAGSMSIPTSSVYGFTFGTENSILNKTYIDPTPFAFIATTEQSGETYYWASEVYSVSESSPNWNGTSKAYTMSVEAASTINTGWTPVPEPSTAMLALAGLALLIKRRRA